MLASPDDSIRIRPCIVSLKCAIAGFKYCMCWSLFAFLRSCAHHMSGDWKLRLQHCPALDLRCPGGCNRWLCLAGGVHGMTGWLVVYLNHVLDCHSWNVPCMQSNTFLNDNMHDWCTQVVGWQVCMLIICFHGPCINSRMQHHVGSAAGQAASKLRPCSRQ